MATSKRTQLLARAGAALLHLLRGGVDLLLGLLHGFLTLLHFLLLERRGGGGGAGSFEAAAREGGGHGNGEDRLHGHTIGADAPLAPANNSL